MKLKPKSLLSLLFFKCKDKGQRTALLDRCALVRSKNVRSCTVFCLPDQIWFPDIGIHWVVFCADHFSASVNTEADTDMSFFYGNAADFSAGNHFPVKSLA